MSHETTIGNRSGCCSGRPAEPCLRLGLHRLQLLPLHLPAHIASEEGLEKLGDALEIDLAAHREPGPAGDGLESVHNRVVQRRLTSHRSIIRHP